MRTLVVSTVALLVLAIMPAAAQHIEPQKSNRFGILHSFAKGEGGAVAGRLTYDEKDNFLYAMPTKHGPDRDGSLVRMQPNGKRFTIVHAFDDAVAGPPVGQVVVHPSKRLLLGVTGAGGEKGKGTIFSVKPNGAGFTVLKSFEAKSGKQPLGAPVLSDNGNTLFGTTSLGGAYGGGTLWRIGSNGEGFTVLYDFGRRKTDPRTPMGDLAISNDGKTLFGTTADGGSKGLGTLFSIRKDGTRFKVLHEFKGGKKDGASPGTAAVFVAYKQGKRLYGTTPAGGPHNEGIVYSIRTDGSGFKLLHGFGGGGGVNGSVPLGAIAQGYDSLTLYGTASAGGAHNGGVLFQLRNDGSRYEVLQDFSAQSGRTPIGGPIVSANGRRLYGATSTDGAKGDGSVYVYDLFN